MLLAAIPSPPSPVLRLGPIAVHYYGLTFAVALAVAITMTGRRWAARGGDRALAGRVAAVGVPAGLVGGRLYFLATSWRCWPHTPLGALAVWHGGLSIWGGIAGGTLGGIWVLRRARADVGAFMDVAAPALAVGQAIGRVGNWFNQELFGGPSHLPWALHIDPAHRPPGYAHVATFHPTFLYELLYDLVLAAVLVGLGRRRRIPNGGIFALYVGGYGLGRVFEELLRIDPSHRYLGLRLNFYVAVAVAIAGLAALVMRLRAVPRRASTI